VVEQVKASVHRHVHALLQGNESLLTVRLLISLTKISSTNVIQALESHYVNGTPAEACYLLYGLSQQQFSRGKMRLHEVYNTVQQLVGN
jgi:hypothetical protein